MIIPTLEFMEKFNELHAAKTPYLASLAYWKMKRLIEEGTAHSLPAFGCYYLVRDEHLLVYYSPDNQMHIDMAELRALQGLSVSAAMYDSIKEGLDGFREARGWSMRYDFSYRPPERKTDRYRAVDFDFDNPLHFKKAAELINQGSDWLHEGNIRKMTQYSAFTPSLWFFVQDALTEEFVAVSISVYEKEVRQTDLDWIYVSKDCHGKGAGRFLIEETIARCKDISDDICVGGTVEFYRQCGFVDHELWVWATKEGYRFTAPAIQP